MEHPPPTRLRSRILFVVINVVSLVLLASTLYNANLGQLRREVEHLNWRWVAAGAAFDVLIYAIQAWRWVLVLRPIQRVSLWDSLRAIYVGLFANEVLPLRAGEVIRCYLLGIWTEIPLSVTLASALIERIFDGVCLIACLFFTLRYMSLPGQFVAGAYSLAVLLGVCAILIGIAMFWKQQTLDYVLGARWLSWVHILIEDLHRIGHSRYLYFAALVSLPFMISQVLPIYAFIRAYRHVQNLPFMAAFALMVLLRLGTVVPQAPGNIGLYNVITVLGVRLFGVAFPVARRFSLILWAATTLPLLIVGLIAVLASELNLRDLHFQARLHFHRRHAKVPEDQPSIK